MKKGRNTGQWVDIKVKRIDQKTEKEQDLKAELWDEAKVFALMIGKEWYWFSKKEVRSALLYILKQP